MIRNELHSDADIHTLELSVVPNKNLDGSSKPANRLNGFHVVYVQDHDLYKLIPTQKGEGGTIAGHVYDLTYHEAPKKFRGIRNILFYRGAKGDETQIFELARRMKVSGFGQDPELDIPKK